MKRRIDILINAGIWAIAFVVCATTATQLVQASRSRRERLDPRANRFEVREQPLRVFPHPVPGVVSDNELAVILRSIEPRFDRSRLADRMPVSLLVHASRLWGAEAQFLDIARPDGGPGHLDGEYLLSTLLSNELFEKRSSMLGATLLAGSPYGIQAVTVHDLASMSIETFPHLGQLSQVLADVGVASNHPVTALGKARGTVADIIRDDAARLHRGAELEFMTAGLSRYARGTNPWCNRFGQQQSFDDLVRRLLRREHGTGACAGGHVPYALVMVTRAHQVNPLVSDSSAEEIRSYLQEISARFEASQNPDGSWDKSWAEPGRHAGEGPATGLTDERLTVTGHALEWMAFAPPDARPRPESIARAARYLVTVWPDIVKAVERDWHRYYPASHAARALWMISGLRTPPYANPRVGKG